MKLWDLPCVYGYMHGSVCVFVIGYYHWGWFVKELYLIGLMKSKCLTVSEDCLPGAWSPAAPAENDDSLGSFLSPVTFYHSSASHHPACPCQKHPSPSPSPDSSEACSASFLPWANLGLETGLTECAAEGLVMSVPLDVGTTSPFQARGRPATCGWSCKSGEMEPDCFPCTC